MNTSELKQSNQAGSGLLTVVALLAGIMLVVQGTMFYKARTSTKFVNSEKNKILAQQISEAGVEDNIAGIGTRNIRITNEMSSYTTFENKVLGSGTYTTKLTTVAMGANADTVDLVSSGKIGSAAAMINARLQLKKFLDTSKTPIMIVTPETTLTLTTRTVPETTSTTTVKDPATMPLLNTTAAYTAFMSSADKKADICHLPGGDLSKANVISVSKFSVKTHISCHGDYLTTDGTCDIYKPKIVIVITPKMITDTTRVVVNKTTYDTTIVIDTAIKTQFLSWK